MKLAIVIFRYFPYGGLQRDMLAIALEAVTRGHAVTVFCERWQGEKTVGVKVVEVKARSLFAIAGISGFVKEFRRIYCYDDFDLLLGFNKMPGLDFYFAGDSCFAHKAYTERPWLYRLAPRTVFYLANERAVFGDQSCCDKNNTAIFSLVANEQKLYARYYATSPERFYPLPPGISAEHIACDDTESARLTLRQRLALAADTQLILCLGSGFHTKGVDISIASFAHLQQQKDIARALLIVGADNSSPYRRQAERQGVDDQVFFLGPCDKVGDLLNSVDLLLHPARKELAGNVLLEAILCGCPVLASEHCGFAHYVTEKSMGELIPPRATSRAIADLMETILKEDREEWRLQAKLLLADTEMFARAKRALDIVETHVAQKCKSDNRNSTYTTLENCSASVVGDKTQVLCAELRDGWRTNDVFSFVQTLQGDVARDVANRQTLRFEWGAQGYYRKWHSGVGWKEILKDLLQGRLPVLGAKNEWLALNKLRAVSIPSLIPVAFGEHGKNPARRESFIVTRELKNVMQLDHFFLKQKINSRLKWRIIKKVAAIAREFHAAGINHRDFYLCHFMLESSALSFDSATVEPEIYLIDLHRAQMRTQVPYRWLVKDLGSLFYSTLEFEWTSRDYFRFLRDYFGVSLRIVHTEKKFLLKDIISRAKKIYVRDFAHESHWLVSRKL